MEGDPDLKAWPVFAILVIQILLFLGHWFVYSTCIACWPGIAPAGAADLRIAMLVLAFSFVIASLLSFRFSNAAVRLFYWAAAVWLGFLNFFFWASVLIRLAWFALRISHLAAESRRNPRATGSGDLHNRGADRNLRSHQRPHHSHSPDRSAYSRSARRRGADAKAFC